MDHIIGTCSRCGGQVTVPNVYMSTVPPRPSCKRCGALAKQDHGAVVPMEAPRQPMSFADLFPRKVT